MYDRLDLFFLPILSESAGSKRIIAHRTLSLNEELLNMPDRPGIIETAGFSNDCIGNARQEIYLNH